jgi:hypothetical protein
MADISQTINVTIDIKSKTIIGEDFGLLLILGTHKVFNDRYRKYASLSAMVSDGFSTISKEYIAASKVFGQYVSPPYIYVGRRDTDTVTLSVDNAIVDTSYFIKINNSTFTVNSGSPSMTAIEIATALVAEITAGTEPVTATDNLDGTYTIAADVVGVPYTISFDKNQSYAAIEPSDTIVNDVIAINQLNSEWYVIIETLHDADEIIALSAWCETAFKLFGTVSSDTDIIDENVATDTTSIAAKLNQLGYKHSFVMFSANTAQFSDAAIFGEELPKAPGSSKFELKNLVGIVSDNLTVNQHTNAMDKNVTTYEPCAGSNYTYGGKTASGIFIDIIRDADYLMQQMQLQLFNYLVSMDKVPYTAAGITGVESQMRVVLDKAVNSGIITNEYSITVPDIKNISSIDKLNRILKDVSFSAILTNSIDYIQINGTLNF